jgi:hypothetical protein
MTPMMEEDLKIFLGLGKGVQVIDCIGTSLHKIVLLQLPLHGAEQQINVYRKDPLGVWKLLKVYR